jgi:pilus assembly protein Flp/PilA
VSSQREEGASAVEYGLMIAAIAAVITAVVFSLGGMVRDAFSSHSACFSSQMNSQSCP